MLDRMVVKTYYKLTLSSPQVAALQKRMHKALVSYYMHRGYHNRIVLTDFGKGAAVNLHQLEKIHRNLYDVINKTDVSCCEVYVLGFSEYFRAVNNLKSQQ